MGLGTYLKDRRTGKDLHTALSRLGHVALVIETSASIHSTFQSHTGTTASTTTLIAVSGQESIVVTDILVSAERKAASMFTLQFTDGAETEILFKPDNVNENVNLGLALAGGWQAWKGADFQIVTTGAFNFTVTIGFYKVIGGDDFSTWDMKR